MDYSHSSQQCPHEWWSRSANQLQVDSRTAESSKTFDGMTFTEDEWSENDVWDGQEKMLLGLVPSQGIKINRLLSSWLIVKVPPMPPEFIMDSRVFVLRLNDGTYAALQLDNYLSPQGEKCFMTINYKYPY